MNSSSSSPESTPEIDKAAQVYRALMEEIKIRLAAIHMIAEDLSANPDRPSGFLQAEGAILQLRFVCELMAHAAIAANQPYGKVEALMDSWHAQLAWNDLKGINANCFPKPVKGIETLAEGKHINIDPKGHVSLKGLLRCYLRCGKLLHRGVVRHAFDGTTKMYDMDWVNGWANRIGELLVHHTALVLDEGTVFISRFYGPDGHASVAIARAMGPAVLVEPGNDASSHHPKG